MGSPLRWLKASLISLLFNPPWVLDILDGLIQKSLLSADRSGPEHRFKMLPIIRKYASRQVDAQILTDLVSGWQASQCPPHHSNSTHWLVSPLSELPQAPQHITSIQYAEYYGWVPYWGDLVLGQWIVSHVRPTSEHSQDGEADHRQG